MISPPAQELAPRSVARELDLVEVVHAGAEEGAVGARKAGGLDNVRLDAKACAQPQNRAGVLRDIGLVERNPHAMP